MDTTKPKASLGRILITPVILMVAGILSTFAILAFGRAHFGPEQAEAPRYIYAAAPFVLLVLSGIRAVPRPVWAGAFAMALLLNLWALPRGVAIYTSFVRYDQSIPLEVKLEQFRD